MGSPYTFTLNREFRFKDIDPDALWAKLCERDRYLDWWSWMRDLQCEGQDLEPGAAFNFTVVSPLPARMRMRVEIEDSSRPDWLQARISGDLEGQASIVLTPEPGDVTLAVLAWEVEVMDRAMRIGARVMRPVIKWSQDWAVGLALERFANRMADGGSDAGRGPG